MVGVNRRAVTIKVGTGIGRIENFSGNICCPVSIFELHGPGSKIKTNKNHMVMACSGLSHQNLRVQNRRICENTVMRLLIDFNILFTPASNTNIVVFVILLIIYNNCYCTLLCILAKRRYVVTSVYIFIRKHMAIVYLLFNFTSTIIRP